jgi:hypothetical protein
MFFFAKLRVYLSYDRLNEKADVSQTSTSDNKARGEVLTHKD